MNNPVTADDLLGLLAARHSEDVFVPECKDGPSRTNVPHRRIQTLEHLESRMREMPVLREFIEKASRGGS